MKQLIILVLLGYSYTSSNAQNTCCSTSNEAFADLANDAAFVAGHDEPLPFVLEEPKGSMITFPTKDGGQGSAYFIQSAIGSSKYLLVYHEWWGLNDYVKQAAERYAMDLKDINVIAVDLYDGKVAETREDAGKYMQELSTERAEMIIQGAMDFAGAFLYEWPHFAQVGWCMGGGWSLQSALLSGEYNLGTVMYYGMPEKDEQKLAALEGPVLFVFATEDQWINFEVVSAFKTAMNKQHKSLKILEYSANHAFANPSNPAYNKEAAEDAYNQTMEFLYGVFH